VNIERLEQSLVDHEGVRLRPYKCTAGKTTIGVGRNLDDVGITKSEAMMLLRSDILRATEGAMRVVPTFAQLTDARQEVLVEMVFNLGEKGFARFLKTLAYIRGYEWDRAAAEMLDSRWAEQVGQRAINLSVKFGRG